MQTFIKYLLCQTLRKQKHDLLQRPHYVGKKKGANTYKLLSITKEAMIEGKESGA